jgi:hypothetical protein
VQLPGTITLQAPLRRIVRAPARSALTIMAIAFIMAPLLAALGATDSASATIDTGERILTGHTGDRLIVDLVSYQSAGSTLVTTIGRSPLVQRAEPGLNTGGYLVQDGKSFGCRSAWSILEAAFRRRRPSLRCTCAQAGSSSRKGLPRISTSASATM